MTFSPPVWIEAAGLETFHFGTDGVGIVALDLGDPIVREVVENNPDAHGTTDTTAFIGARSIAMQLHLNRTPWATRQHLRSFTRPALRPTLFFQLAEDAPIQQVTVRPSQWSDSFPTNDYVTAGQQSVTVQWVAPLGIIESAELHSVNVFATGEGVEGGRDYDLEYDRTYVGGTVIGETVVENAGDIDAYPVVLMYGPATNPTLTNVTQDKSLVFAGLTIAAGEFLEVDMRAKTIRYQGSAADSRYSNLDMAASAWWSLSPGANTIRFLPETYTSPAQAVISFRDSWL